MKVVRATLSPYRLVLRSPLETARVVVRERRGVLLGLHADEELASGWGDACPLREFGTESRDECASALEELAHLALGRDARAPDALLDEAEERVAAAPAARAAFDAALSDLAARSAGLSLGGWLGRESGRDTPPSLEVNALLSGESGEELLQSARDAQARGYRTLKLKVAKRDLVEDLERVASVRKVVGPDVRVRLDANGGWSEEQAAQALDRLGSLEIEYVEQPVAAGALEAMTRLRERSEIAIAADESASSPRGARSVIDRGAADLLILKPATLGGLRATRQVAACARRAGVEIVVTSFLDSSIGTTAAAHLAASLVPRGTSSRHASGLATASLFVRDLAAVSGPQGGSLRLPDGPGLGVAPDARALARVSDGTPLELRA